MKKYTLILMGGTKIEIEFGGTIEQFKNLIEEHQSRGAEYVEFPHPEKVLFMAPNAILGFETARAKPRTFLGGEHVAEEITE